MKTREEMIDWIINDDIEMVRDGAWGYFANLMYEGFKGYQSYTDEELRRVIPEDILARYTEGFSHNLNTEN